MGSKSQEEMESAKAEANTRIATQKDLFSKLQIDLDEERANISALKENYDQHLKEFQETLKEKEVTVNQLNEQNNNMKNELFNAQKEMEKAKVEENSRFATQNDLF